ncbi:MAG: hypothetical protein CMK64_15300 [Pseudoalteromonas sp.]|nr:hypothetical protein [Pseudoalteromonas sp.]
MKNANVRHAKSLIAAKQYLQASTVLETLLQSDHKNVELLTCLSLCQSHLGNKLEAIAAAIDAVRFSGFEHACYVSLFSTLDSNDYPHYLRPLELVLLEALNDKYLEGQAIEFLRIQFFAKYRKVFAKPIESLTEELELMIADPLFIAIVSRGITPHHQLEKIILLARKELLYCIANNLDARAYQPTINAIACQNLLNDGVYFQTDEELALISALAHCDKQFAYAAVALKICYANFEQALSIWAENKTLFEHVSLKLLGDDLAFYASVASSPSSEEYEVADATSLSVQSFYAENPYPKYKVVKLSALNVSQCMARLGLEQVERPNILIAGCGTGLQAIELAYANKDGHVTAIDISPTSLNYAKKMASKYQLENIEFKLHDILNISSLGQKFDYIVSTGVLHHMSSPQAGLNALAKQLKNNRLMVLGFYSKQGRRQLSEIRDNLIRHFNANGVQDITKSSLPEWRHSWSEEQKRALWFCSNDFFNTHGLMDAILHPQETYYDTSELKDMLDEAGLSFKSMALNSVQRSYYQQKINQVNPMTFGESLERWGQFESLHPDFFYSMYNFFVYK